MKIGRKENGRVKKIIPTRKTGCQLVAINFTDRKI